MKPSPLYLSICSALLVIANFPFGLVLWMIRMVVWFGIGDLTQEEHLLALFAFINGLLVASLYFIWLH